MGRGINKTRKFGRYWLERRIAVGGMGEVYLARYTNAAQMECVAVVKLILDRYSKSPDFLDYFSHEGRILSVLNHPNVVHTLELGKVGDRPFIAMEYVPGPTLVRMLAQAMTGRPFSIPLVFHLAGQIARALEYIHGRRSLDGLPYEIIHMDLAPHNILVSPEVQVKVLDFGISRATGIQRLYTRRAIRGRTAYLAPEQLWDLPLDQRLDIYALGVMIHEMVLCRPLFRAQDDQTTAKRILYARVPRLRSRRPDCPEGLERLVLRALQRDRDRRYCTISELVADLDQCQDQEGIVCVPSRLQQEQQSLLRDPAVERPQEGAGAPPAGAANNGEGEG